MKKTMKIIALSGPVGVGKDSLADCIIDVMRFGAYISDEKIGSKNIIKLPIAFSLKKELQSEIRKKYNLDSFSEHREEKEVFRDDLINHAETRRKENSRYWIDKWMINALSRQHKIISQGKKKPLFIVSDLRHAIKEDDDLQILKQNGALTIYIEQYHDEFFLDKSVFPYREYEQMQDKALKENSDFTYRWTKNLNYRKAFEESKDTNALIEILHNYMGEK